MKMKKKNTINACHLKNYFPSYLLSDWQLLIYSLHFLSITNKKKRKDLIHVKLKKMKNERKEFHEII